jgi:hypothetical protein
MTINATEMRTRAENFAKAKEEKEWKDAHDFVNNVLESKIKASADKGRYYLTVDFPITVPSDKVVTILIDNGFEVKGLGLAKTIEW